MERLYQFIKEFIYVTADFTNGYIEIIKEQNINGELKLLSKQNVYNQNEKNNLLGHLIRDR